MKERARFTGKVKDRNGYAVHLFYEYRGREYMITDEHNGYSEPMWVKHQNEQRRIDEEIEREKEPVKEWTYAGSAQEGFDLFWKYVESEEEGE